MEDRLKEIKVDIANLLNDGYSMDELTKEDRADVEGFIWGIAMTEMAFDNYTVDLNEGSTFNRIRNEVAEEIWDTVYSHLISDAVNLIYSHIDGYEPKE